MYSVCSQVFTIVYDIVYKHDKVKVVYSCLWETHQSYRASPTIWDHTVLPATWHSSQTGRYSIVPTPKGWMSELTLVLVIHLDVLQLSAVTHPSSNHLIGNRESNPWFLDRKSSTKPFCHWATKLALKLNPICCGHYNILYYADLIRSNSIILELLYQNHALKIDLKSKSSFCKWFQIKSFSKWIEIITSNLSKAHETHHSLSSSYSQVVLIYHSAARLCWRCCKGDER